MTNTATSAAEGFTNGYPSAETSEKLYDEMDYQRAVQAYIWAVPLVNSMALVKGFMSVGATPDDPKMMIIDKPLTPKQVFMTGNSVSIYANSVINLAKTGPYIIDIAEGGLGGVVDMWQRAVEDIGVGASRNGGKFLLLPPGYSGQIPDGYFVVRCRTNIVFLIVRALPKPGEGAASVIEYLSNVGMYPLTQKDTPKTGAVVRIGGVPVNTDWPKDFGYFEYMAEALVDAVIEPEDKLMYAMLEPLGIAPGKSFQPDERIRRILTRAADTGAAIVANMAFANRFENRQYWANREWEKITFATTPEFETTKRIELDERTQGWYQLAMNARYIYTAKPVPGEGSWYASAFRDGTGAFLDGAKNYRLRVDANPPARQFWSVTVYDNRTRSMIDTDQQRAGLSGHDNLKKNADGSVDLYFGPNAPTGYEENWIKTIPGQGFFAMFRLFGPLQPLYDQTWKLNDIEPM